MPINYYGSHWQPIIVLNALRNDKDTSILFLDSLIRLYHPSFRMHVSHKTGQETNELEIEFLNRFMKELLIKLNPTKYQLDSIPEIEVMESTQQQGYDCCFSVLKTLEW